MFSFAFYQSSVTIKLNIYQHQNVTEIINTFFFTFMNRKAFAESAIHK